MENKDMLAEMYLPEMYALFAHLGGGPDPILVSANMETTLADGKAIRRGSVERKQVNTDKLKINELEGIIAKQGDTILDLQKVVAEQQGVIKKLKAESAYHRNSARAKLQPKPKAKRKIHRSPQSSRSHLRVV